MLPNISPYVIDAGTRIGSPTKFYHTVQAMLDDTASVADGEFIMADTYFYEGAGSGASDHHLTNAGGSKLYCIASPYVTPDQFGAPGRGNDETDEVNAAIASRLPVFLNRYYDVTNVVFPATSPTSFQLIGGGSARTGLYGRDQSSPAVLLTGPDLDLEDNRLGGNYFISNFGIRGNAMCGLGIAQTVQSYISNINLDGFNSDAPSGDTVAVQLEYSFGNVLQNITTGYGCKTDMRVAATVLATSIFGFTANNSFAECHIDIDVAFQNIAYGQASGNGVNFFRCLKLSGCRGYAVKVMGHSSFHFYDLNTSDCNASFFLRDTDLVVFKGGSLESDASGHGTWLDQTEDTNGNKVTAFGTQFEKPVVLGGSNGEVYSFLGTNVPITSLKKTNSTYKVAQALPVSGSTAVQYVVAGTYRPSLGSTIGLKASTGGAGQTEVSIDGSGNVSATAATALIDVDEFPFVPISTVTGVSSSLWWRRDIPITPMQINVAGGTAPYTYEVVGDYKKLGLAPGVTCDPDDGEISGTPTGIATFPSNTITGGVTYIMRPKITDSSSPPFVTYGWRFQVPYNTPNAAVQNGTGFTRTFAVGAFPYTFSSANGSLLSLTDFGYTTGNVTLTASAGTLSLSGTTGLTFQVGDGTSDATMTFTGTLTNITAALANMTWSHNASGSFTVTFAATNENGTTTRTIPFTVTA